MSRLYANPGGQASESALWVGSREVPRPTTMEPSPPFHGSASEAGGIYIGGIGINGIGIGGIGGGGGVILVEGPPTHLTNMAGPCIGQTPRTNCSVDAERGEERRSPLSPVRRPWK